MICCRQTAFHELRNQGIDMQRYLIAALLLTALSLTTAPPATAQSYRSAAGWGAGVFLPTSLNDGAVGANLLDMKPDMTWTANIHYDRWLGGGNIGIRGRAGFSKPILPWVQGDREIAVNMVDLGVLLRPIAPGPGRSILPFLGVSGGFIRWRLGDGLPTTFDPAGVSYAGEEGFDLAAVPSLGIDIVTPWRWGDGPLVIRLEGTDYIQFSSPFDPANPQDAEFGMIHNAAVLIGFHTGMGVLQGGN
jgi:hypothetical protein